MLLDSGPLLRTSGSNPPRVLKGLDKHPPLFVDLIYFFCGFLKCWISQFWVPEVPVIAAFLRRSSPGSNARTRRDLARASRIPRVRRVRAADEGRPVKPVPGCPGPF